MHATVTHRKSESLPAADMPIGGIAEVTRVRVGNEPCIGLIIKRVSHERYELLVTGVDYSTRDRMVTEGVRVRMLRCGDVIEFVE